ncbi:putative nucleotidyltransferase [Desulfohalotomaculum tongense]|uniref:nucleotidyltransferase domain-containing protein n=1 Tax=Desulforadius tongensis TaxID=1216062 RepID=UPI00195AA51D|nr:putative nucleotidyltransferase [Desulforadius tongensis]
MVGLEDNNISTAINEFCTKIKSLLKDNIIEIRLFGSVAKGTATSESDIDILVILKKEDAATEEIILDTTVDMNLKYNVVIAATTITEKDYSYPPFQDTLFYKNIQKEGLPL